MLGKHRAVPGALDPPVFQADFGTIGIQICFDVNWSSTWAKLKQKGAEILFWPSAFAAPRHLSALAWQNQFYVASATLNGASRIFRWMTISSGPSGRTRRRDLKPYSSRPRRSSACGNNSTGIPLMLAGVLCRASIRLLGYLPICLSALGRNCSVHLTSTGQKRPSFI